MYGFSLGEGLDWYWQAAKTWIAILINLDIRYYLLYYLSDQVLYLILLFI